MRNLFFITKVFILLYTQNLSAQTKADTIHVSHYDINLEIRDFSQQEIKGYTDVEIVAKTTPLLSVNLDFLALTVDSIKKGQDSISFLHQGEQLKIDLPFLSVGDTQTVRIYYHGKPQKDPQWGGFYFTNDFAYNMGVGMGSYPHSFGRVWFPCVDEFTDKSTYTFHITTDADKKAICGGMLTDSTNLGDAMRWKWELTHPIPTYLASVAVGNYQSYKDTIHCLSGVVPVEIYANPAYIQRVPGSFVNLKSFVHTYEKRWGPYRWQRVGYVVVPFNGGAMEHATNIGYPQFAVNGNTTYQNLISHELAHSWFGNLITCSTSQNMWINEGFASYGEYLCDEMLDTTLQTYKTKIRNLHMSVINRAHTDDGGYFALDSMPSNVTYGTTTYDKGALVTYTLRNYMGDELFFYSIKQFLELNQYSNVTSEEFFSKLSQISEMNLHDFYLGWVHQPGFLNFNIDSITPVAGSNNTYQIAFKQRLHHAEYFANSNIVEVEFVSTSGERYLEKICFSGEHDTVKIELPFEPAFWAIDPNGKMGDLCYDYTQTISKAGTTNFASAFFRIQVTETSGESTIRIEYNPFAPTPSKNNLPHIVKISEKRFWRVGFLQYNEMQAHYSFNYDSGSDYELLNGYTKDDLVLLYRKDAAHDWQIIPVSITGGNMSGRLEANILLSGEYTLGICDNVKVKELENRIEISPNPTKGELRITSGQVNEWTSGQINKVEVFDVSGRKVATKFPSNELDGGQPQAGGVVLNISHLPSGVYFLQIKTDQGIVTKKVVKK